MALSLWIGPVVLKLAVILRRPYWISPLRTVWLSCKIYLKDYFLVLYKRWGALGSSFLFLLVLFCLRVEYMFSLAVKAQSRQHDKWVSVVKVKLILPSLTWAIEGGSFIVPGKVIRQSNCILYCPGTSAWRLLEQFIYHGRYSMFCLSALTHPHCWPARRFW